MRTRFLVLASVAGLSLASLAGSTSAATTVTASITCTGVYSYSRTSTVSVKELPPGVTLPYSKTYSFPVSGGSETCTVTVS